MSEWKEEKEYEKDPTPVNNDAKVIITKVDNGYILKFIDIPFDTGIPIEKTWIYEDDTETHEHFVELLWDLKVIFGEDKRDPKGRIVDIVVKKVKE